MKKLSIVALALATLTACNKNSETKNSQSENTTQNTSNNESQNSDNQEVVPAVEALAISEKDGLYTQSFKLVKGETYPLITHQKNQQNITTPENKTVSGTSESIDEMSFMVNDFKDGVYDITINLLGKSNSQTADGKTITVDTKKNAPADPQLKMMWNINKALVGNTLNMKMKENGEIVSVQGFDAIYKKVIAAVSSQIKDVKEKTAFSESFKAGFNEKTIKEQLSENLMVIPIAGAKIGQKWTKSEDATADGSVKLTSNYTLESVENGIVTISVSGGIPKKTDKNSQQGLTQTLTSELSQLGMVKLNQKTGWIDHQNISIKTNQTETITDGKESQSMKSSSTATIIVNP